MRRLSLTIALAAALCLLVPLGSSGASSASEKATAWLGTWETDSGKLYFDDLYRARSDCTACGNPRYWALEGRWNRPGKSWTKIWGALSSKDPGTFQGEWKLAKSDPYDESTRTGAR